MLLRVAAGGNGKNRGWFLLAQYALVFLLLAIVATMFRPSSETETTSPVTVTASGELKVYFLDVGQGDSILLKGPDFTFLIDAGRHDRNDVVPQLEQIGIESIDLFIGTHPHADHIGQFPQVLRRYPVSEVWLSGDESTTQIFEDTIDAITESGAAYHEPRAGEEYQIGSAHIEVLNPETLTGEANEGSVVVRIRFGNIAFMFMGDAEVPTERAILARGANLKSHILKLGHHGSDTSSSPAFIEAVQPEVAIWSAGVGNTYGHPKEAVIERLQQMGITVYGTAIHSTIIVTTDGERYEVELTRPNPLVSTPNASTVSSPTPATSGCQIGQININTGSAAELQKIIQIGPTRAQAIIELRPFTSLDDLQRVEGIGGATIEAIKAQDLACVE